MSDEAPFEELIPEITLYMPSVSEPAALIAIRDAAIEFCQQTHIWVCEHDPISISAGVNNYTFDPPCDAVVVRVHNAWYDGTPIYPTTEDALTRTRGVDWRSELGTPQTFIQFSHDEIVLVPTPDTRLANGLKLTAALAPSRTSTAIARSVMERWGEKIAYGARSRLYGTARQPYSDAVSAINYARLFREGIGLARIERNRSLTRATNVMRFPNFI